MSVKSFPKSEFNSVSNNAIHVCFSMFSFVESSFLHRHLHESLFFILIAVDVNQYTQAHVCYSVSCNTSSCFCVSL